MNSQADSITLSKPYRTYATPGCSTLTTNSPHLLTTELHQARRLQVLLSKRHCCCAFLVFMLATMFAGKAQAKPGDLDPTYGSGGIATATFNSYSSLGKAALQPDGKLVVVGQASNPAANNAYEPFIARFNVNGTLDTSFGNGGFVITRFAIANQPSDVYETGSFTAVAIQPDGKIIAGGTSQSNWCCSGFYSDPILARYNANGTLDTSFGNGGRVFTNTGISNSANGVNAGAHIYCLTLAPDGSFYAVGGDGDRTPIGSSTFDRPALVLKYSSAGALLASAFPNYGPAGSNFKHCTSAVLQSDGKLVTNLIGGGYGGVAVINDFLLMRFNPNLSMDTSFGTNGFAVTDFGTGIEQANGLVLDPDGTIAASGSSASSNDTGNFYAARYNSNGTLDTTFGSGGKVIITPSQSPFQNIEGQAIARQPDGKYVVGLGARYGGLGAIRLLPNGALDPSFGDGGIANYQTGDSNYPYPTIYGNGGLVLLQSDGKILLPATDANNVDALNGVKILRLLNTTTSGQLVNISTRLEVMTGNQVAIGGFIIKGSANKQVLVRALGPTLSQYKVAGVLPDPVLTLHHADAQGHDTVVATNDNWQVPNGTAIQATGKAPPNPLESAILATLAPGNYTAVMTGKGTQTGVGLVEVYDQDQSGASTLANISTRGFVSTGSNVMIGGFVSGGSSPTNVIVRALGPTLSQYGVSGVLANPSLELHDANGVLIASNDDWTASAQKAQIQASGYAPSSSLEPAIIATRSAGNTTAIVKGVNNTTGNALVEVYQLP